jgi:hypothetical protein
VHHPPVVRADALDPNGFRGDWVRGDHERVWPCCTALPPGPRTRWQARPTAACPDTPAPARSPSPRPVRPLGPRSLLHDPHPPGIRGLRRRVRLLPANSPHRRTGHDWGPARAVATDSVTGSPRRAPFA